jgi:y4mF family transcriptional regulator
MVAKTNNHGAQHAAAFGATVRKRRKALRLTQTDVADLVGVTRQTIGRLERGDATVSLGTALAVAGALGIPIPTDGRDA